MKNLNNEPQNLIDLSEAQQEAVSGGVGDLSGKSISDSNSDAVKIQQLSPEANNLTIAVKGDRYSTVMCPW